MPLTQVENNTNAPSAITAHCGGHCEAAAATTARQKTICASVLILLAMVGLPLTGPNSALYVSAPKTMTMSRNSTSPVRTQGTSPFTLRQMKTVTSSNL